MNKLISVAALAVACVGLSGCLTSVGRAAVKEFKPIEARIVTKTDCGDLAGVVLDVAEGQPLTGKQVLSIVRACEKMRSEAAVIIDPEAARKAMPGL